MKQIEAFVDSIYQQVGGNKKEIEELKAEMKNHLIEAVHDLKTEGKSEQEAIEIAINRFGGEHELRSIVGQLFKAQKSFAQRTLTIAISFLVLTFVSCIVLWRLDVADMKENDTVAEKIFGAHNIVGILEGEETVSKGAKEEIDALVQNKNQILNLNIYKVSDIEKVSETGTKSHHLDEATPVYQIGQSPSNEKYWMLIDLGYIDNDNKWYVQIVSKKLDSFVSIVFLIGFAIYATLFTIWATVKAYHQRRLNAGWVIAFAFLNVVGYLVFYFYGKRSLAN
jgi:hypothetical protein